MIPQKQIDYIEKLEEVAEAGTALIGNGDDKQLVIGDDALVLSDGAAEGDPAIFANGTLTIGADYAEVSGNGGCNIALVKLEDENNRVDLMAEGESESSTNLFASTSISVQDSFAGAKIGEDVNEKYIYVGYDESGDSCVIAPSDGHLLIADTQSDNTMEHFIAIDTNEGITLASQLVILSDIPTSDPEVVGALWNDNGVLKISAGK